MASRSFSVGGYTRNINEPEDPFNTRVRATLDGEELDQDNPENWPAEKVKAAAEMFQRADERKIINGKNATAFLEAHPEFIDGDHNADLMNKMLDSLFGEDRIYSVEQFEAAYEALRATNKTLQIDGGELVKKQQAADDAKRKRAQAASVTPTEQELYEMPLEDVRRLDAMEVHSRMQREGERGGNGF